jgi:hypothetical protein
MCGSMLPRRFRLRRHRRSIRTIPARRDPLDAHAEAFAFELMVLP